MWSKRFGWMVDNTPFYADIMIDTDGTIYISGSREGDLQYSKVGDFWYYPFTDAPQKVID